MSEKKLVGVGGPEPLQSMNERELWNAIDRRGGGGSGIWKSGEVAVVLIAV